MRHRRLVSQRPGFGPALRFGALTRFYDPVVATLTRERASKHALVEVAAPRAGERVLDVGCGTGSLALELARRTGSAVCGVDADDAMLVRARRKAERAGVALDLQASLAQELPFPEETFGLAVSSLFFHHLVRDDKLAVASEILRVLRPGGRLAVADWGAPRDRVMRVAALGIRLLDGAEPRDDRADGIKRLIRLPACASPAVVSAASDSARCAAVSGRLVANRRLTSPKDNLGAMLKSSGAPPP